MPETKISQDVRQDAKGRLYRVEYYVNSGRIRQFIYVEPPSASTPMGYTIPQPVAKRAATQSSAKRETITLKRKSIVERADSLRKIKEVQEFDSSRAAQQFVDEICRPLMRYDGKEWHVLFPTETYHYVQYHLDQ